MRFRFPKITVMRLFIWIISVPCVTVFLMVASSHSDSRDFKVTQEVFFLVERGGKPLGELVFGLYGEAAPRTVKNFVTFATKGYKGMKYEGSKFHRVIKNFMIQGGDVVSGDGQGSVSIYGKNFADETVDIRHSRKGTLSMANRGPNTNGCQFFVTTIATPWLDGHHVVFGKLMEGEEVLNEIESSATDHDDRPLKDIIIYKSGRRPITETYYISDDPYNLRDWMKAMMIPIGSAISLLLVFNHCMKKFDAAIGDDQEADKKKKKQKELEKAKKQEEKRRLVKKDDDDDDDEEEVETEEELQEIEETEEEEMKDEEQKVEKKEAKKEQKKEKEKKDEGLRKRAGKGDKTGDKKK